MKKSKLLISIIIATYNSEKILPLTLESIRKQQYPQSKIEILVIDGGSTDATLKIAKKYHCKVVHNPKTEPVYAKYLGFLNAKGKYALYIDSDEVFENQRSIATRYEIFKKYPKVKAVIGSGYKSPHNFPFINQYINEFGDPFSFYIYRLSKDARFFAQQMKAKYPVVKETRHFLICNLQKVAVLPIIELVAMAGMFDLEYLRERFPEIKNNPSLIPHFFYLINKDGNYLAIVKNDPLHHYSSETLRKYLGKITWRIKNNIHHVETLGLSGFTGREKYQPLHARIKKYFFLPYAFLLIPSFIDAVWLSLTRRNMSYFIHVPLCLYTAIIILQQYSLKMLGIKPRLRSYGDVSVVDLK